MLFRSVNNLGREWREISYFMGRTSSSVINKWRELGGETYLEKRKNEWSIEEIAEFLKYIELYSDVKFLKENYKNNVLTKIKEKIKYITTRSNGNHYFYGDNRIEHLRDLLAFLRENDKAPLKNIKWDKVAKRMENRSMEECKKKWEKQLYFMVIGKQKFSVKTDIELIETYY